MFLFSRKKKKGLKGFMVLVGTADSLAEHTLYEYKVYLFLYVLDKRTKKRYNRLYNLKGYITQKIKEVKK